MRGGGLHDAINACCDVALLPGRRRGAPKTCARGRPRRTAARVAHLVSDGGRLAHGAAHGVGGGALRAAWGGARVVIGLHRVTPEQARATLLHPVSRR
jgi:hypothetical protein